MKGPPDFEKAMHGIHMRAKLEAGYNASLYLQMLYRHGGLGTAKQLINSAHVSQGYTRLYELKRLDLTVEALVIDNSQWHNLFTDDELRRARKRLREYGYDGAS
jgi:hypothetical protein